jgi:hypothetical protein
VKFSRFLGPTSLGNVHVASSSTAAVIQDSGPKSFDEIPGPKGLPVIGTMLDYRFGRHFSCILWQNMVNSLGEVFCTWPGPLIFINNSPLETRYYFVYKKHMWLNACYKIGCIILFVIIWIWWGIRYEGLHVFILIGLPVHFVVKKTYF